MASRLAIFHILGKTPYVQNYWYNVSNSVPMASYIAFMASSEILSPAVAFFLFKDLLLSIGSSWQLFVFFFRSSYSVRSSHPLIVIISVILWEKTLQGGTGSFPPGSIFLFIVTRRCYDFLLTQHGPGSRLCYSRSFV